MTSYTVYTMRATWGFFHVDHISGEQADSIWTEFNLLEIGG